MEKDKSINQLAKELYEAAGKQGLDIQYIQFVKTRMTIAGTCTIEAKIEAKLKDPA